MSKIAVRFLPMSFSLEELKDEEGEAFQIPSGSSYEDVADLDPGDTFQKEVAHIEANDMVVFILSQLNEQEKILFLCQIVRGSGYEIPHNQIAKSLQIELRRYYINLKQMREKVATIHKHYFASK